MCVNRSPRLMSLKHTQYLLPLLPRIVESMLEGRCYNVQVSSSPSFTRNSTNSLPARSTCVCHPPFFQPEVLFIIAPAPCSRLSCPSYRPFPRTCALFACLFITVYLLHIPFPVFFITISPSHFLHLPIVFIIVSPLHVLHLPVVFITVSQPHVLHLPVVFITASPLHVLHLPVVFITVSPLHVLHLPVVFITASPLHVLHLPVVFITVSPLHVLHLPVLFITVSPLHILHLPVLFITVSPLHILHLPAPISSLPALCPPLARPIHHFGSSFHL